MNLAPYINVQTYLLTYLHASHSERGAVVGYLYIVNVKPAATQVSSDATDAAVARLMPAAAAAATAYHCRPATLQPLAAARCKAKNVVFKVRFSSQ